MAHMTEILDLSILMLKIGLKIISKNFKNIFQDFKRLENSILILI